MSTFMRLTTRLARFLVAVGCACLLAGTAGADFITPSWRGAATTTWYQWGNPPGFGEGVLISEDPELYSYAPTNSQVPDPAPGGTASLVTPMVPSPGTGNLYNFSSLPVSLAVPSFLTSGTAGTVVLQVRGFLGEFGSFIGAPTILSGTGQIAFDAFEQLSSEIVNTFQGPQTRVERLYGWTSIAGVDGPVEISMLKGNHASLIALSVDTLAAVPEPTSAALAAAAALMAAGHAGRRFVRRRRSASASDGVAPAVLPSSNCSSSSPSSACSSGSCSPPCRRPESPRGAAGA
jgi:hypothetical protein